MVIIDRGTDMIEHYNAFISYKHADIDNKVAASIVKGLERYHIPGKIRKKTGLKKIERIFRDISICLPSWSNRK